MEAIDLLLARYPERGINISRGLWATLADFWDGQSLAVFYTFDEETVTRQSVRLERIVG
jgi:hypothetical protein